MVADMVTDSGTWDWHRLQRLLPTESLERIAGIHPPCNELGDDLPRWRWEINGQFSTRSAYAFLHSEMDIRQNTIWPKVWGLKVPQWIRVFAWLVLHGRLLTNVERVRRHCAASELCEVCHGGPETIEHVLRSCLAAKGVWGKIIPSASQAVFYTIPLHEWLIGNMFETPCDITDENWLIRFIILCWMIWKRRCSFVLAPEARRVEDILTSGDRLVAECRRAFDGQAAPSVTQTSATSWSCPPVDWVQINVDATVSTLDCTAAIGAVFRDCEAPADIISLVEDDKVLSNLVRLLLGHVGVPFDPGVN
ncbi:hypothetical protein V6N13_126462 [Hibiscus sabdariffa]